MPGMYGDGRGLYLRIAAGGSKSWILQASIDGRRRDIGLGGFRSESLAGPDSMPTRIGRRSPKGATPLPSTTSRLCFHFLVLTAARSGEARNATWQEIDARRRLWTIPAERMKTKAAQRVPLSGEAMIVLEQARRLDDGSGLLFPSPVRTGRPLSAMTLSKLLRTSGIAARTTAYGFRSAFRDWCAETARPRELAEAALAHAVGRVEGAYFRSGLLERHSGVSDVPGLCFPGLP